MCATVTFRWTTITACKKVGRFRRWTLWQKFALLFKDPGNTLKLGALCGIGFPTYWRWAFNYLERTFASGFQRTMLWCPLSLMNYLTGWPSLKERHADLSSNGLLGGVRGTFPLLVLWGLEGGHHRASALSPWAALVQTIQRDEVGEGKMSPLGCFELESHVSPLINWSPYFWRLAVFVVSSCF